MNHEKCHIKIIYPISTVTSSCRYPYGCSLGIYATAYMAPGETITECAYRIVQTGTQSTSPRVEPGRMESYTHFDELGLCYVAGPAALINAACVSCANCSLALDFEKPHSQQHVTTIKPITAGTQLTIDYGRNYRADMFCCSCGRGLGKEPSAVQQPHVSIVPALAPIPFNSNNTAHYIAALHAEAQIYYSATVVSNRSKLTQTKK